MKSIILGTCFVLVILVSLSSSTQAQVLPQAFCSYCINQFRSRGCLNRESPYCKLLALKFTFKPFRQDVCEEYPCVGYGQSTGNSCTGLLSCPINKIRVLGICPLNQLCCAP